MARGDQDLVTARRRGRPRGEDRLSRDIILSTAVEMALATSMEKVSVRGIAARLGVSAMAIYNHVAGKAEIEQHLLAELYRTEVRWIDFDTVTEGPDILRAALMNHYHLTLKYPDILLVTTHNSTMPEVLRFQEELYEGLRRCGLPPSLYRQWARIFGSFVSGAVQLHNVTRDEAWERLEAAYQHLDKARYPNLAEARAHSPTTPLALFEVELDALIHSLLLTIREIRSQA